MVIAVFVCGHVCSARRAYHIAGVGAEGVFWIDDRVFARRATLFLPCLLQHDRIVHLHTCGRSNGHTSTV
jgi:hypothetical protein